MKYQIVTFQTSSFEEETGILLELVDNEYRYYARVITVDKEIFQGSPDQITYINESINIDDMPAFMASNLWIDDKSGEWVECDSQDYIVSQNISATISAVPSSLRYGGQS